MEFTVRNVKVAEFLSEETLAFEATVYVDGIRAFRASNQGHGGCNMYDGLTPGQNGRRAIDAAEAWCKEQPEIVSDSEGLKGDDGTPFSYQPDLDHYVDEAVATFRADKELGKLLKKVVLVEDGQISTFKVSATNLTPKFRADIAKRHPKARIFNDLPADEQREIWKATAA